jgi:hypothetical protein
MIGRAGWFRPPGEVVMSSATKWATALATAAAATAYAGTSFVSTWKAPDAELMNFKGKKVAALVVSTEQAVRFGGEDALAAEITARGAVGVPAYSVVPKELLQDKEKAKAFLEKADVRGVIAMRVVGKDKEVSGSASSYWGAPSYASFWGPGYWGWSWGGVYAPGYMRTDTIVIVETLVYNLEQDKLVWAGQSQTTNPSHVPKFIKELAKKVADEMKKQKLIR